MTPFKKAIICFGLFICGFFNLQPSVNAQNLFDLNNSYNFGKHLYKSGKYVNAAQEFERVVYLDTNNYEAKFFLIKSYHRLGDIKNALARTQQLFVISDTLENKIGFEYATLLLLDSSYNKAISFATHNSKLDSTQKLNLLSSAFMLESNWEKAEELLTNSPKNSDLDEYSIICQDALNTKYKSPFVAASLSTVVPGLGKIYSGEWKDGLFSALMVGVFSWQSYRGFKKNGVKSGYGWIYGSLGFGTYLGNIWGSSSSAKKVNQRKKNRLNQRVNEAFYNTL